MWRVNFDPTVGAEIRKTRPAIVISSDAAGRLPIKLIAPVTDWKDWYARNFWHVRVEPGGTNGLSKISAVDTLQIPGADTQRFLTRLGHISPTMLEEIVLAIAAVIEHP